MDSVIIEHIADPACDGGVDIDVQLPDGTGCTYHNATFATQTDARAWASDIPAVQAWVGNLYATQVAAQQAEDAQEALS